MASAQITLKKYLLIFFFEKIIYLNKRYTKNAMYTERQPVFEINTRIIAMIIPFGMMWRLFCISFIRHIYITPLIAKSEMVFVLTPAVNPPSEKSNTSKKEINAYK